MSHWPFIWGAYGFAAVVLLSVAIGPNRRHKALLGMLKRAKKESSSNDTKP